MSGVASISASGSSARLRAADDDTTLRGACPDVSPTAIAASRVISAGGGRRRPEQGEPGTPLEAPEPVEAEGEEHVPVVREADPELERLLAEEEEIERRTRQHHETPHFRGGED